jgi:glycosyltransferase involved in cell wall biosynthesis
VVYVYPVGKWVSFRAVAEAHIAQLRRWYRVMTYDEEAFVTVYTVLLHTHSPLTLLHPFFYPIANYEKYLKRRFGGIDSIIGLDVADTNRISEYAVRLTENAEALIVPSNFAKNAYMNSGCRRPVHVVPHGVPDDWIGRAVTPRFSLGWIAEYKERTGRKLLHFWVLHSWFRKGEDIAYEVFSRLVEERGDVALLVRRPGALDLYDSRVPYTVSQGVLKIESASKYRSPALWMEEGQLEELFSMCDVFLLASRGGGFEHPPLLAMAKGAVVVGARGGAWEDYLPPWSLVDSHESPPPLPGNPIHTGTGVEMDVEKAVDRLHTILDNMDDYKARVAEYVDTRIRNEFTWSRVGVILKEIVDKYLYQTAGRSVVVGGADRP